LWSTSRASPSASYVMARRTEGVRRVSLSVEQLQRRLMYTAIAGRNDAAAVLRTLALPIGDNAAGPGDDRDQRGDVVGLELGLDHEVEMAGREHAVGVAIAAIARQFYCALDATEDGAVGIIHQQWAGRERSRVLQISAPPYRLSAFAGWPLIVRGLVVAGEAFADEGLVHHAEHRNALVQQCDQRAPDRKSRDKGFGAVDRIQHPDVIGIRAFVAELLADDAVLGKLRLD